MNAGDRCSGDIPRLGPPVHIPSELHSEYERGPFHACTVCRGNLADGRLYQVQKVVRGKETVFEMAMCEGCALGLCEELPEDALQALKGFFIASFKPSPECCHCHFCELPRPLAKSYTIAGICRKELLILPAIVLCDRCAETLQARISKATRAVQDDFIRSTFPGVPADLGLVSSLGGLLL